MEHSFMFFSKVIIITFVVVTDVGWNILTCSQTDSWSCSFHW